MNHIEKYGPVQALHLGRNLFGVLAPLMTVRCYAIDGMLVDSGLACLRKQVLEFARHHKIKRVVLTHHHEDHSGNSRSLKDAGLPIFASEETAAKMEAGFSQYLYQKLIWSSAGSTKLHSAEEVVETSRYQFQVLPAPGHCDDQIVLYEASQGWLFSGDAFIAERIKFFRADEDFGKTVQALKSLVALNFEQLFCAHRPVRKQGRLALQRKLDYLLQIEDRVRQLAKQGDSISRITKRVLGPEDKLMFFVTLGDMAKRNLVRSILLGPRRRRW